MDNQELLLLIGKLDGKVDIAVTNTIELQKKVDLIWNMEQGRLARAEVAIATMQGKESNSQFWENAIWGLVGCAISGLVIYLLSHGLVV